MKIVRRFWHDYGYLIKQWIAIAIMFGIGYAFFQYRAYLDRGLTQYLSNHHCEELGRVGQPGQYVYKCDNGLHLESDLRKETGSL
jgi:hypothetical protein